jgi:geranylgeranyl pyrophosphate synthase
MPDSLDRLRQQVDSRIAETINGLREQGPERSHPLIGRLYSWMRHYLDCNGKRMHGIAVLLAYRACGGDAVEEVASIAAAFQLYHHHTLVHDDIYDEDVARRGWPTTHKAFAAFFKEEASIGRKLFVNDSLRRGAITAFAYGKICRALAGHMILASDFPTEARLDVAKALDWHDLFDNAAQLKDVDYEGEAIPDAKACLENAWLKTGRLFEICAFAGARLANATESQQNALKTWAGQSALAYQLQDDLEDLAANSEKGQGRGVGTDLVYSKPTYLFAVAKTLAKPSDIEILERWQSSERTDLALSDIISIFDQSGAIAACRAEVARSIDRAAKAVAAAEPALRLETLPDLATFSAYFCSHEYWHRSIRIDGLCTEELLV